jgi:hypothetical protein
MISWLSKKQSSVYLSTTDGEYIATTTCCTQVLRMKHNLQYIQVKYDGPISILCDNTNAIGISKNLLMHSKMKHISIKYHFIWDQDTKNNIKLEYARIKEHIVDIFIKLIVRENFE